MHHKRKDVKQMNRYGSVARQKTEEEFALELANKLAQDTRIVESVRVSMAEIAAGDTVSFEEAFGVPGPR
jgi:PHD/YefM family antitoxin component YafN of YafNO toxin-antitoxin module